MRQWFKTLNGRKINISASLVFGAYAILIMKTSVNSSILQTKLSKMEVTSFYLSQCWMRAKKINPGFKVELFSKWSSILTSTIPIFSMSTATIISKGTNFTRMEIWMSSRSLISSQKTFDNTF